MTRDEAVKAIHKAHYPEEHGDRKPISNQHWGARWVDAFVALGMLKLDEPPKRSKELLATIRELRSCYADDHEFLEALEARGFKIVEK